MGIIRAMIVIPRDTGVPADAVTNTWHFNTGGDITPEDAGEVRTRLLSFYNDANITRPVGEYLSKAIDGENAKIKVYDLADAEPRTPVYDGSFPIDTIGTGDPMVAEVALCLSYHAEYVSGTNRARLRGRIYLGPLAVNTQGFLNNDPIVAAATATDLCTAAARLVGDDTPLLKWSVYSPTGHTAHAPVVGGWVDNAYDTQRRRGRKATVRTPFLLG